jgi:transposase
MSSERKELSAFQRGEIIGAWKCKLTEREIGKLLEHPKSTVHNVIAAYKEGIEVPAPRSGRPPILTERDGRHLMQILNKNRRTNINELCENFISSTSTNISKITLKRYLHKLNIYGRIGAKNLL